MEQIAPLGPVYQAGTLSGNPLAMSAGYAVLNYLFETDAYVDLEKKGLYFERELKSIIESNDYPMNIARIGSVFWMSFDGVNLPTKASQITSKGIEKYTKFFHLLLDQGFYFAPSGYEVGFLTVSHSWDILENTMQAIDDGLKLVF